MKVYDFFTRKMYLIFVIFILLSNLINLYFFIFIFLIKSNFICSNYKYKFMRKFIFNFQENLFNQIFYSNFTQNS